MPELSYSERSVSPLLEEKLEREGGRIPGHSAQGTFLS